MRVEATTAVLQDTSRFVLTQEAAQQYNQSRTDDRAYIAEGLWLAMHEMQVAIEQQGREKKQQERERAKKARHAPKHKASTAPGHEDSNSSQRTTLGEAACAARGSRRKHSYMQQPGAKGAAFNQPADEANRSATTAAIQAFMRSANLSTPKFRTPAAARSSPGTAAATTSAQQLTPPGPVTTPAAAAAGPSGNTSSWPAQHMAFPAQQAALHGTAAAFIKQEPASTAAAVAAGADKTGRPGQPNTHQVSVAAGAGAGAGAGQQGSRAMQQAAAGTAGPPARPWWQKPKAAPGTARIQQAAAAAGPKASTVSRAAAAAAAVQPSARPWWQKPAATGPPAAPAAAHSAGALQQPAAAAASTPVMLTEAHAPAFKTRKVWELSASGDDSDYRSSSTPVSTQGPVSSAAAAGADTEIPSDDADTGTAAEQQQQQEAAAAASILMQLSSLATGRSAKKRHRDVVDSHEAMDGLS